MKKFIPLITSGIFGGLMVLIGLQLTTPKDFKLKQENFSKAVKQINIKPKVSSATIDFVEAAKKTTKSVVHITAKQDQATKNSNTSSPFDLFNFGMPLDLGPREGTGSGVIISKDGYIVTNNHVVEHASHLEVTLSDNNTYFAEIVGTYPKADLAVIKIDASNLKTMVWGDSDKAEVGEWVLAVGNPLELNSTVTAGIISAKSRNIDILKSKGRDAIESFIQTDAVVNPGNSGGALVNTEGELLGINTAIKSQTGYYAGYSFAIPSNIVKKIVDDIIQYGTFQRAYLGVSIAEVDSEIQEELEMDDVVGVYIAAISDGGSAQYAGLLPKDIIIQIENQKINSVPEIQEVISKSKVGDTINVTIIRKGAYMDIPVRLKAG